MGTMNTEAEAGQIALKEERHRYILELLGSEGRVLAADLAVDTGSLKTRFVEICANWRVRERSNGYTAAPCLAVPRAFLSCLANKSTWRARSELLERRLT
jgi:hypothetical protein